MGNFFSQYDPERHSCTPGANNTPASRSQTAESQGVKTKKSTQFFRKKLHASSNNENKNGRNASRISHSETADQRRAGFLDLPAELRNNIYSRVLICDGYVRLTDEQPTKVPALVLLRVCKQVHDEAASVFYAANSFYCYVTKQVQARPGADLSLPTISPDIFHIWRDCPLLDAGGVFFPAPRYHLWLTRITIDTKVVLTSPPKYRVNQYPPAMKETDQTGEEYRNAHRTLTQSFETTFQKMKELWDEKDTKWDGTMVGSQDNWTPTLLYFSTSFYENEEDELATKRTWRNWS